MLSTFGLCLVYVLNHKEKLAQIEPIVAWVQMLFNKFPFIGGLEMVKLFFIFSSISPL